MNNSVGAVLFVGILLVGLGAGWVGGNMNSFGAKTPAVSQTASVNLPVESAPSKVVNLDIIADWGGSTYDAFVISSYANGTLPKPATNSSGPGPNDNNITVPAGVPITFVITSIDTAVNQNFTGNASTDFTIYNDTASGYVALHYNKGQAVPRLPVGHTFTIPSLNINIPIPADTVVTFTYTFNNPGVYEYLCVIPCGPGMGLVGYMNGYVIVG